MCFQYACESVERPVKGEEMYFWQCCRHEAAVELFTLITFPLMPTACWNQRAPSGPKKPVMWPAFVVCWSSAWERQGQKERERAQNCDRFFFFCSKMSQLPPTSLVAYKNRVIVFICVFTLPYLEIAVINQYEAGSRDLSRSRDQSCDLSVSSFSSNTSWKGISRTSSICFPCFTNDSKKPKRIIKELHILPYLRTKQYAGWVYRSFRR